MTEEGPAGRPAAEQANQARAAGTPFDEHPSFTWQAQARRNAFRIELEDAIRPLADPREIELTAARLLERQLAADRVIYVETTADGADHVVGMAIFDQREVRRTYPLEAFGGDAIASLRAGRTLVIDDVSHDPTLPGEVRSTYAEFRIAAHISVPIRKGDRIVAILSVQHASVRSWTPDEVGLAEETAERTWTTVQRAHAEAAEHATADRLAFLLDLADRLREISDPAEIGLVATERLGERLGALRVAYAAPLGDGGPFLFRPHYARDGISIEGQEPHSLVHAGSRATLLAGGVLVAPDVRRIGGLTESQRAMVRRLGFAAAATTPLIRNGTLVAVITIHYAEPHEFEAGELSLIQAVADRAWGAIARRAAEIALRAAADRQAYGARLADAIRPLDNGALIEGAVTRVLGEHLGANRAFFVQVDADGEHITINPHYALPGVPTLAGRHRLETIGGVSLIDAYRSGITLREPDVQGSPSLNGGAKERMAAIKIAAFIAVPLIKEGRLAAVMGVHSDRPRAWTDAEVELTAETAERAWVAIQAAETAQSLRRRERLASFIARMEVLRSVSDPVVIEDLVTGLLATELAAARCFHASIDHAAGTLTIGREHRRPDLASYVGTYPLSWFTPLTALLPEHEQPLVVRDFDVSTLPRHLAEQDARATARAFIVVPRMDGGHAVALLAVMEPAPRAWTEDEVMLVVELARRTWESFERAEAVAALRVAREHLDAALSVARMGYWDWDPDRKRTTGSASIGEVLGLADGQTFESMANPGLAHPDDREAELERAMRAIATRTGFHSELRIVRPRDGETAWIDHVVTFTRDPLTGGEHMTGIVHDITERKRADAALAAAEGERERLLEQERRARADAEAATRLRDEFLAIVSHELRTPLAAILLWSRLLTEAHIPGRELEAAQIIMRNADTQLRLVEDLLDASRVVAGTLSIERRSVALRQLISGAALAMEPAAREAGVALVVARVDAVRVRADETRISQVLRNLLDNAIGYTGRGGSIRISGRSMARAVVITVEDEGTGFDEEILPTVFDRFRRGRLQRGDRRGGLGLGLAISRDIAELHGGTLHAANWPEGGAVLTLTLPSPAARSAGIRPAEARERRRSTRSRRTTYLPHHDPVPTAAGLDHARP